MLEKNIDFIPWFLSIISISIILLIKLLVLLDKNRISFHHRIYFSFIFTFFSIIIIL